jgi:REP element-mobilizing transposase RayT
MPTGYQIKEQDKLHYLTLQVVGWVDIFTRQKYRDTIISNLAFCQKNKNLIIYAYVIMSNHIHLLVRSSDGNLSGTIGNFKSYTSKEILKQIMDVGESRRDWMLKIFKETAATHQRNSNYQFWTHENHAEFIYSNKFIDQKINYIYENPVRSGIVTKAEDYYYSSARNYAGVQGLLDVEVLRPELESGKWKTGGWESGGWKSGGWESI